MYSINFTVTKKKFCLSLHYNGANSYLFVNGIEVIKFKAKDLIVASPLYLGNISKNLSSSNMKKTGLNVMSMSSMLTIQIIILKILYHMSIFMSIFNVKI